MGEVLRGDCYSFPKIFFSFEIVFWRILNDGKCTCEFLRQSLAHPLAKVGWIYYPPLQCTQWRCPCRSCLRIHLLLPVPTVTPSQSGFTGVAGALVGYEPISDRLLVVRLSAKPWMMKHYRHILEYVITLQDVAGPPWIPPGHTRTIADWHVRGKWERYGRFLWSQNVTKWLIGGREIKRTRVGYKRGMGPAVYWSLLAVHYASVYYV